MSNSLQRIPQQLRLNKFLAERLGLSRREADQLISDGRILVNGKVAVTGAKIDKSDKVCYNNSVVPFEVHFLYLALNKPVGYVCSRRAQGGSKTIYDLLPKKYHNLKSVGRLDRDSSGLILLTNDGDFAFSMTHPKFRKNKVYEVELDKPLEPLHQQMISDYGVEIGDGVSRFKILRNDFAIPFLSDTLKGARPSLRSSRKVLRNHYTVFLTEGRNRQIRRTFASLGYTVTRLHRTQFGKYELGDLKPSKYVIIEP